MAATATVFAAQSTTWQERERERQRAREQGRRKRMREFFEALPWNERLRWVHLVEMQRRAKID